ncbi:hypothetical protein KP509_34G015800 [Ceratopteris richardii]|uniref:N6-adenosine-methyltransferase MT-A70-like n=1 Tax=Ceratopteris richardii TaxID=49495 RepID=A0A8T2QJ19_CERRI|nr:hypothetical protein KP509_34G015800 [Ceratopteris richardii]KAH7283615.1 hypothetical protein KP509_34G015800 [Ceratopteris richardii]
MEGDDATEELIVMRQQRRQLREQLASQRKARLEIMNSLQHLVPELVSSLELSMKVVSSFSGKERNSSHILDKQGIPSSQEGPPLPSVSSLPGLPSSGTTPRSSKLDSSIENRRGDSESARASVHQGNSEERWELDKDSGSDNKGPDAALAVVKRLIAGCLLSSSTSVPIDSAGLHRRLPKDPTPAEKSALLEVGGDRGGIAAVEFALQALSDENAGIELEEFTVSGKTRLMVLAVDRNRLAKEFPISTSQPKAGDEVAHSSGSGMEMTGGSFNMSPMPSRPADMWVLGGDMHMHAPPLGGSGPHMYPGAGVPPMMGPRMGPRMMGMHGAPPNLPGMGLGYGAMHGGMQRPNLGALQAPVSGVKAKGSSEEEVAKDLEAMLAKKSYKELQKSKTGEELLDLLHRPTAKETAVAEKFKTKGGSVLKEYCPNLTKEDCQRQRNSYIACEKVHFRRIIAVHTDVNLGDCSFLDTCRHMKTCKYVHYELDPTSDVPGMMMGGLMPPRKPLSKSSRVEYCSEVELGEPQWINCDIRTFRMDILGQFGVIMADPPWDIHMELPYGTMADDEMRNLNVPALQTDGLIFLWVTGRAMELGRECLELWGYRRVEELIWVKTNQLQRIIRTGRTGHWLNHSKEHCLVGIKGQPEVNRNIDTDVIVAEVRETSRKPDEMYPMLERISPRTRKLELFARMHNTHAGWISLGNQLNGVRLVDEGLRARFKAAYPDVEIQPPDPPTKSDQDQGGFSSRQEEAIASGAVDNPSGMPADTNDGNIVKEA